MAETFVPRSEWELTAAEAQTRRGTSEACLASIRARGSTEHRDVTAILEKLVARARRTGDPVIPVRVDTKAGPRPSDVPEPDHAARIARTIGAFERVFSETCPAGLVRFVARPLEPTGVGAAGLEVKIDVSWSPAPWKSAALAVHAPTYVFDVVLRGEAVNDVASFRLSLPPPAAPQVEVRPRSLFEVKHDEGVHPLLSARAFDRLYDELHTWFFRGEPRVPLAPPED